MFKKGQTYTHRNMLDAAIFVLHVRPWHCGIYDLRVRWVRRDGFDFGVTEWVRVVPEQLPFWRRHGV